MKICTICKLPKALSQFGARKGLPSARAACRACENAYQRTYRERHPEECRRRNRVSEARRRVDPRTRQAVLDAQKATYRNGGKERQKRRIAILKEENFFLWKSQKSYVWLTPDELQGLWEKQGGRCALTGRPLDGSAELDHIIPKSRGGDNTLANTRWLCRDANQAKRNLLDSEFLALCEEIREWIGRQALAYLEAQP